ncbi:hypothetical protein HYDPIDRAFT_117395 [Hydnomerulius pinastri MD-312]|uniref:Uncharacterized protein n=1 Tax=Hydnomerulius pinastri MD-312 TaxID=994086 RepID=A0A0C9W2R5_9AGAM|nr:hypothetical protein HYDPIDRAFT_117395 [Hydnomerulius pinastri MD-312]
MALPGDLKTVPLDQNMERSVLPLLSGYRLIICTLLLELVNSPRVLRMRDLSRT